MRVRHDAIDAHRSGEARRSRAETASTRVVLKCMLATLLVALALTAAGGFFARAQGLRASRVAEASQDCSARYAALLDLAELARRDGKSSEVVMRGLSERGGAMSACLPADRGEPAPR